MYTVVKPCSSGWCSFFTISYSATPTYCLHSTLILPSLWSLFLSEMLYLQRQLLPSWVTTIVLWTASSRRALRIQKVDGSTLNEVIQNISAMKHGESLNLLHLKQCKKWFRKTTECTLSKTYELFSSQNYTWSSEIKHSQYKDILFDMISENGFF